MSSFDPQAVQDWPAICRRCGGPAQTFVLVTAPPAEDVGYQQTRCDDGDECRGAPRLNVRKVAR